MEGTGVRGVDIHSLPFTGRWLNLLKTPKRDWLYILKALSEIGDIFP
jgi:hypothetical protein